MRKAILVSVALSGCSLLAPAAATVSAQGPREGIKVHGHWTIDVVSSSGASVVHREFDNALLAAPVEGLLSGTALLARVLTGAWEPSWQIVFGSGGANAVCDYNVELGPVLLPAGGFDTTQQAICRIVQGVRAARVRRSEASLSPHQTRRFRRWS